MLRESVRGSETHGDAGTISAAVKHTETHSDLGAVDALAEPLAIYPPARVCCTIVVCQTTLAMLLAKVPASTIPVSQAAREFTHNWCN